MRRRFKSSSDDPSKIQPGRNQGSDNPLDMSKSKRVRFADPEMDNLPNDAQGVSSRKYEATQVTKSDAPKTSEYAYFKKVKYNAGCGHSRATHREDERLETSKFNDHCRDTSNASAAMNPRKKDLRFKFPGEIPGPTDHHLFLSPRVGECNKLSQLRGKDIPTNVKPVDHNLFFSPLKGSQCTEKGIFSAKRQKLLQCVADASFCDIEKLHSKGFDLVSSLLSRLFPKSNENDDSRPSKGDMTNNCKTPTFWESDDLEKGRHWAHTQEGQDWDKDIPENHSGRSREIVLSKWNTSVSEFSLSNYDTETHFGNELVNLDCSSESDMIRSSYTWHNSFFCSPFERYGYAGSCHLEELDEFCCPIEYARNDPHRLLLGWDFQREEDKVGSSIINHDKNLCPRWATSWNIDHRKGIDNMVDAKALCPSSLWSKYYLDFHSLPNYSSTRLATSWNVDHQNDMDNVLDAKALCSSSLCSKYSLDFDSLPNYYSTSFRTRDFGPFIKNECALAEPERFSLALPFTPKYNEAEDCNIKYALESGNVLFSRQDPFLLTNKVSCDKHHRDFELLLPGGLNMNFGWKCLPTRDSFPGDHPSMFHPWQSPQIDNGSYSSAQMEKIPEKL